MTIQNQFFVAACLFAVSFSSAAQTTFQKTFGGSSDDYGFSVRQTSDGGYVLVGCTHSFGAGGAGVYLIRTDASGDTLWTKTIGGIYDACGFSIQQTSDSGFVIAGDVARSLPDLYLIKTDLHGDTLWTKIYRTYELTSAHSVEQTNDGGYVITGQRGAFGAGSVYLVKTDAVGDTLWTRTFGGSDDDAGSSGQQTYDGGYVITGIVNSFVTGDVYLIKTNGDGDTLWTKIFGGSGLDIGTSVQQTSDRGYVIAGYTNSFGAGNYDVYLIKTNASGDTLWTKTFGGTDDDRGRSVQQASDAGYVIAGYTRSLGAGNYDVYLIKTNAAGDTLWTKTFGGIDDDQGFSVQQATDGGYVIAGSTVSFGVGLSDVYLIKTDPNGVVSVPEERNTPASFSLEQNYPNPFNPRTVIRYRIPKDTYVTLKVYDVLGREIKTLVDETKKAGYYQVSVDLSSVASAVYFYRMISGNYNAVRKLIVVK